MNHDEKGRSPGGETDEKPPAPHRTQLSEQESLRKDTSYSPASETETDRKQEDPLPDTIDDDIDPADVRAVPGTGGPDDTGDVEVDPEDLNLPRHSPSSP